MNFDTIASKILSGMEISREEGRFLLEPAGGGDAELFSLSRAVNERLHGNRVTYVRNRNLNFTNICAIRCKFCGFCREEQDPEAYTLAADQFLEKIAATPDISEVCIQGAIHPRVGIDYYLLFLKKIKLYYPSLHIHGVSPQEVHSLSLKSGWPLGRVIGHLMEAGLDSMAGTAAEILVDRVRARIAPEKISSSRWVEIVKTAHRMGLKSTATILMGHLETDADILEHLDLLRAIQRETLGFTEFIPLPFIPYRTRLGEEYSQAAMAPWPRLKRLYALARVFLHPSFENIQTSWVKLGLERALDTLEIGANDFGGTLHEENITRSAGGTFGQYLSVAEIRETLCRAGKIPRERDTLYRRIETHA